MNTSHDTSQPAVASLHRCLHRYLSARLPLRYLSTVFSAVRWITVNCLPGGESKPVSSITKLFKLLKLGGKNKLLQEWPAFNRFTVLTVSGILNRFRFSDRLAVQLNLANCSPGANERPLFIQREFAIVKVWYRESLPSREFSIESFIRRT